MGSQLWLGLLSVVLVATLINGSTTSPPSQSTHDEDNKIDTSMPIAFNPKYNKMLPDITPGDSDKPTTRTAPPTSGSTKPTKQMPTKDDFILTNKEEETDDEDDDDYDTYDYDYYSELDSSENNKTSTEKSTTKGELKPIKGDDLDVPPYTKKEILKTKEEVVFSENVPCPRDCICERNFNDYLVATCSRLDEDVQKFGSDITDLVVVNVGPKYPIVLGPEFFFKVGLKHVSSIKIANCTVEYIHPSAFHGLDDLYAVNLTSVGLTALHPDTFANNSALRLLTISGNDLRFMTHKEGPFSRYMLKAPSVEDLDLSNSNLQELQVNAFKEFKNVIYINLAKNSLKTLPEAIFDQVDTIEELDLSYNSINTLPKNIFNRTALSILNLSFNSISNNLDFVTSDLTHLDLSYCAIRQLTNAMLRNMEGITNLNLKGNGIVKIQPEAFIEMRYLRHIDLSLNRLDQVSSLMFFKNPELDVIRLNDNPRLSQLPPDGFICSTKYFNVHHFDVSNCAIESLGPKTFSTMPYLITLKMAWNNINNLDGKIFHDLDKLVELDLSNNLIRKLDRSIFSQNRELTKLNLAGNVLKEISAVHFAPTKKLRELDVSECDLTRILTESDNELFKNLQFYSSLRTFNASANKIKNISRQDLKFFKGLKTLDITNNPLKCNEDFRDVMKWLGKQSIVSGKVPMSSDIGETVNIAKETVHSWDALARSVCKHEAEAFLPEENIIEKEEPVIKKDKIVHVEEEKNDAEEDTSTEADDDDEDEDEDEDENKDDENDSEYYDDDEDDEEDEDEEEEKIVVKTKKPVIKDNGLLVEEVNLTKETEDKWLRGKLMNEDEIIIERGRIYYSSYRFLWPILIVIFSVIILLILIGKVVSLLMRKRGERYRQALLASKNSIVYQKLSEEISAPQTPKVHRYAPINQV